MTQTDNKTKILIIAGGLLHEREVSLRSGHRLATALRRSGFKVQISDIDERLLETIDSIQPDIVWPMVHGKEGESGSLQDLLDILQLKYIGSSPKGARIAWSKPVSKAVVSKNGLATPEFVTLPKLLFRQLGVEAVLNRVTKLIPFPVIVKPASGGSAMGISKASNAKELRSALVNAFAYDDELIIERFVEGTEVSVCIVDTDEGIKTLPLVEIVPTQGSYDTAARYAVGTTEFFTPARLNEKITAEVKTLGLRCHQVLELDDLSRIDIIVDQKGIPWFIDSNVIPGMTDTSIWPLAAEAESGFEKLVSNLVHKHL